MRADDSEERRIGETYVVPFYNRVRERGPELAPSISAIGRSAPLEDILEMLGSHWRPRQMGGWYALTRNEQAIIPAVLESLRTSRGYLTSPELAVAAVTLAGRDSTAALVDYVSADLQHKWGGSGLVMAALESLGASSDQGRATSEDKVTFEELMQIGRMIQDADTTIKTHVRAVVTELPTSEGLYPHPVTDGMMSLLIDPHDGGLTLGCVVRLVGAERLTTAGPGSRITLDFWDSDATSRLKPGSVFSIKFSTALGSGLVDA